MKMKHPLGFRLASIACVLTAASGFASLASAATYNVITPSSVSYIDDTGDFASPDINRVIDSSGVSSPIGATITTSEIEALTVTNDIDATGWRRNGPSAPSVTFTFTLQDPSVVSGILLANYWEGSGLSYRGLSSFSFQYSTDNGDNYTNLSTINPSQSDGGFEYIDLGSTLTGVTNIRFSNATYFSGDGANITGLNEVRFVNAVPETSTALLGGLGVLALLRRRRA